MLVGEEESVTAFSEDSALVATVLADDSALTTFFQLVVFSALGMIFTLANLSADFIMTNLQLVTKMNILFFSGGFTIQGIIEINGQ